MRWIYAFDVSDFSAMTNLPVELRGQLEEDFNVTKLAVEEEQCSSDGTAKLLLGRPGGDSVEAVGIPEGKRLTVCFSTQVGCAMACTFCATGLGGFVRNLTAGEMVDEVQRVGAHFKQRVSNAVAMGQGEPFLNYDETMAALRIMNSPDGLGIGARHITVSTCGVVPGVERFAGEPEQFGLAISLHSAIQGKRAQLMPVAGRYKLDELGAACREYAETNRRITFEYALIAGENDGAQDLKALIDFCAGMLCNVNLIPLNPVEGMTKTRSDQATVDTFLKDLNSAGIETSVRLERGTDIDAACGQLKRMTVG